MSESLIGKNRCSVVTRADSDATVDTGSRLPKLVTQVKLVSARNVGGTLVDVLSYARSSLPSATRSPTLLLVGRGSMRPDLTIAKKLTPLRNGSDCQRYTSPVIYYSLQ
jgi:hypothetical protein